MDSSNPSINTAYILGAGFSKAISINMPSTDELGNLIIRRLTTRDRRNIDPPNFLNSRMSFESWLSWLAEKQPFESDQEYHSHFSNFLKIQSLIAKLLSDKQTEVLATPLPRWLSIFVQLLHESESTVVTLNYDSLLETAFDRLEVKDSTNEKCDRLDITKIFPRQTGIRFDGLMGPLIARRTFDLFKLHGSIDWFWIPGDITGASLEIVGRGNDETPQERKASAAARGGKSEFLVPPTHLKNTYLENSKSKYQWEQSYKALKESTRVVIAGYSVPESDSAMASMLSQALSNSKAKIIILNPVAQQIRLRIESLGIDSDRIECFDGRISIQNYVEREVSLLSKSAMDRTSKLWKSNRYSPLAVAWDESCVGGVTGVRVNHAKGELTLHVDKFGSSFDLKRPGTKIPTIEPDIAPAMTYSKLLQVTQRFKGLNSVRVKIEDDGYRPIVGFLPTLPGFIDDPHHPERNWLIFRPLGSRPGSR